MLTIFKRVLRGMLALGITSVFMVTYGCSDDNSIFIPDTTPNAFTITPKTNVATGSVVTSDPITVSGINLPVAISVTGGTYSINGGTFTSTPGVVTNGQTVTVAQTASATNSTGTTAILTIGGVSAPFTVTTAAVNTTPTAFSFTPQTGAALGSVATSNPITVAGLGGPAPISVNGGTFSVNGGAFTSTPGTVNNGDVVTVRQTASALNGVGTSATLNIGGMSVPFTTTTTFPPSAGTTPTAFTMTPQTGVALNSPFTSNTFTVAGLTNPAPISVNNGTFSINGGAFTSTPTTVTNGQTVAVNQTSATTNNTGNTSTLTIGGVSAPFTTTTRPLNTTPTAFSFTPQTGVATNTAFTSSPITVAGLEGPAPISVNGGMFSIDGGTFTSTAGTVNNGQTVNVQQTSSTLGGTPSAATLTIGGFSTPFMVTTK